MKKKKALVLAVAASVVLAATVSLLALIFHSSSTAPDPETQTPEEKVDFLASEGFQSLPDSEKKAYFEKVRKEGGMREMMRKSRDLPEEQRDRLRGNTREMFHAMMKERIDQYFSLPTKEEKVAYLDKLIAEGRQRREEWRKRAEQMTDEERKRMVERFRSRGGEGRGGRGQRRAPSLDRIKQRIESTSPEERAKFTEFRLALRARREATRKPGESSRRGSH